MSSTEIFRLGREPGEIGEVHNSWRGAMAVWNDIAKRYLGLDGFPITREAEQARVWNAHQHAPLTLEERIVLLSTMDHAVLRGSDLEDCARAFEAYGQEHPESSLGQQAEILRKADIQPDDFVAWNQTSVSEFWGHQYPDDEDAEPTWYNPNAGDIHFDFMAAARRED